MISSKAIIRELFYWLLIEMRFEAYTTKQAKIFHLADLIHNSPQIVGKAKAVEPYDDLMEWIMNRAKQRSYEEWLEKQFQHIKEYYHSDPSLPLEAVQTYFVGGKQWVVHNAKCLKVKIGDLKPGHLIKVSSTRPNLRNLSDEELIKSVVNPETGNFLRINIETGEVVDGNGRAYELLRRMNDTDSSISSVQEIPYLPDTPDIVTIWKLK